MQNTENHEVYANQLSCPNGEMGIQLGLKMNTSHKNMIYESITALKLKDKNRVLELGHGNCNHLNDILKQANDLRYFGMEISETMRTESEKNNSAFVKKNIANFQLYNGKNIPYVVNFFDTVLTVNTIYFYEDALEVFNEIYRVLKPKGKFVFAFVQESFMSQIPFVTQSVFKLYNNKNIEALINKTKFKIVKIDNQQEPIILKDNTLSFKPYTIVTLKK
ncbi:hypothetical protein PK35_14380 [Tamlana nanhaiensis]|uniref:Methyltransferase type 11 domain-containing protein n=1 Tax=Neotamlana nanhaiensis TaxID=1382798 RepID=A0A0D7VYV4_9FLAO|nr:hypothetical protein PK35_14380 [Tamlana nanhaiensis]